MRISDCSSDVCSSDLSTCCRHPGHRTPTEPAVTGRAGRICGQSYPYCRRHERRTARRAARTSAGDRKSVVQGKSVSVRVDLGGCRLMTQKNDRQLIKYIKKLSYSLKHAVQI